MKEDNSECLRRHWVRAPAKRAFASFARLAKAQLRAGIGPAYAASGIFVIFSTSRLMKPESLSMTSRLDKMPSSVGRSAEEIERADY